MGDAVGVVGLGIMGSAYVQNMLKAGRSVVGFDVDADKVAALQGEGMQPATSSIDVAKVAPIVVTSLPSAKAFHAVMDELASSGSDGLVVIDTCTLALDDKIAAHDALAKNGITLLDCPVSGTGAQAAAKDLAVLGSGDADAFEKARVVLADFSRTVHYVGPFGNGSKMKYIANLLVAIHNVSAAEAMVLGMKSGLDPQMIYDVVTDGAGNSRVLELRGPMMVANDYTSKVSATMTIQDKDMRVIGDFIRQQECPTPLFDATIDLYKQALAQGLESSDTASVCAVLEKMAGISR